MLCKHTVIVTSMVIGTVVINDPFLHLEYVG